MDVEKLFSKIKELGHTNSRREELREFCKLKIDHIFKFLPRRILNSDGADVLDCILNGIPDSPSSLKNKAKIVDIVLQAMRIESTSLTHCSDVISRLCLELPRLSEDDLVRWSNDSVQSIVEDNDVNTIWRHVLPECLNALKSYNTVKHCGTEKPTSEYKEQCIHTLCQCQWKEKQLVQLAAMFKDMQLSRNEHRQVVNKICSYIIDFPPDTLPPLVHQLLKLCKSYNVEVVLSHLSYYFNVRMYNKLEPAQQDSESTTMDIDDIVQYSAAELSRCLSTCIYHIAQGAAEPEVIRKHIKLWPRTQLLRSPFLVDLALALSDKGRDFRSVCLDVIRSAIEQRIFDDLRSKESAWTRSVLPPDVDVASVLKILTTESASHRELTVSGLVQLAFSLLGVPRTRPTAAACWSLGKLVAVRLCKSQPQVASHILTQLADRIATAPANYTQYADCLHVLCALTPVPIERCPQLCLMLQTVHTNSAVLEAVHPLLNFSTRTRDTIVMVCRKGLYARESTWRAVAVSGLLSVLRHVAASGVAPRSGSEPYSAHSYLTQLTVDLHATSDGNQVTSRVRNEAVCMEVVSILRRCLMQDAPVKQLLYTKLYDCAKEKSMLHEAILELLYEHLIKYLPEGDSEYPLLIDKCVQMTPTTAVLQEPIAHLLYAIAQFIRPSEDEELEDILGSQGSESGTAYLKSKLNMIMDKICASERLARMDMEEAGLTDQTPESKAKCIKVQQTLLCYEALVAHRIMQWNTNSEDAAHTVYTLFKACHQLLEQTKTLPKASKKNNTLALNETKETQKSQKSQKSQKEKGKNPVKFSNLVKDRAGPFKPLPCLWDLKLCLRVMELLYNENVAWCSNSERNGVRSKRDFHQWCLRCVQSALAHSVEKRTVKTVADIAAVLYNRCICRFQDMCEFDDQTTLCCIEVFKDCFSLLLSPNYSLKLESFLPKITEGQDDPSISVSLILNRIHSALVRIEEDTVEEERDALQKKMAAALMQTAAVLLEIPVTPTVETSAVVVKLQDYVRTSKQDCLLLIPALLTAEFREQQEAQFLEDLLQKLTAVLGRIDEDDTSAGAEEPANFASIDPRSGQAALAHVCCHLAARCRAADHLLHRARDLAPALNCAVRANETRIEKELKELYKSLLIQLSQLTLWTCGAAKLRCVIGGGSDKVLAACVRLYTLLAAFVKQIDPAMAVHIRLERLLKQCGKKFSAVSDNLITYLEAAQQQTSAAQVLRHTKLIPRLVLEAETFTKHVIMLATKAKTNFQQYLSLGTARDFRIKGPVLQEVLQARPRDEPLEEDDVNINDAETEVLSASEHEGDEENNDSDQENSRRKRRRVS